MKTITIEQLKFVEKIFRDWSVYNNEQCRIQDHAEGDEKTSANKNVIYSCGVLVGMQAVLNQIGFGIDEDGDDVKIVEFGNNK